MVRKGLAQICLAALPAVGAWGATWYADAMSARAPFPAVVVVTGALWTLLFALEGALLWPALQVGLAALPPTSFARAAVTLTLQMTTVLALMTAFVASWRRRQVSWMAPVAAMLLLALRLWQVADAHALAADGNSLVALAAVQTVLGLAPLGLVVVQRRRQRDLADAFGHAWLVVVVAIVCAGLRLFSGGAGLVAAVTSDDVRMQRRGVRWLGTDLPTSTWAAAVQATLRQLGAPHLDEGLRDDVFKQVLPACDVVPRRVGLDVAVAQLPNVVDAAPQHAGAVMEFLHHCHHPGATKAAVDVLTSSPPELAPRAAAAVFAHRAALGDTASTLSTWLCTSQAPKAAQLDVAFALLRSDESGRQALAQCALSSKPNASLAVHALSKSDDGVRTHVVQGLLRGGRHRPLALFRLRRVPAALLDDNLAAALFAPHGTTLSAQQQLEVTGALNALTPAQVAALRRVAPPPALAWFPTQVRDAATVVDDVPCEQLVDWQKASACWARQLRTQTVDVNAWTVAATSPLEPRRLAVLQAMASSTTTLPTSLHAVALGRLTDQAASVREELLQVAAHLPADVQRQVWGKLGQDPNRSIAQRAQRALAAMPAAPVEK